MAARLRTPGSAVIQRRNAGGAIDRPLSRDGPLLGAHLEPLHLDDGRLAVALYRGEVVLGERARPQRPDQPVRGGDGVLDDHQDPVAADGGDDVGGVADEQQAGPVPALHAGDVHREQRGLVHVGGQLDATRGVLVAALAGRVKHALRHVEAGVDIVVAQSYEAGGHTGTVGGMVLTPSIVDAVAPVPVPVLAAGGIGDGRQMAAALALGASGVWCGSIWLASVESDVLPVVKERLIGATAEDTVRTRAMTGKPSRLLRTAWVQEWERDDTPDPLPNPLHAVAIGTLVPDGPVSSFSMDLLSGIDGLCARAEQDADVRGVILTGTGRTFSIGTDLDQIERGPGDFVQFREYLDAFKATMDRVEALTRAGGLDRPGLRPRGDLPGRADR